PGRHGAQGPAARRDRSDEDGACARLAGGRNRRGDARERRRPGRRGRGGDDDRGGERAGLMPSTGQGRPAGQYESGSLEQRPMSLHLIKLCVGADSVGDLEAWIKQKLKALKKGARREHIHTTRMVPKRADELIDGGSLYWVIRGQIMCRQKI